MKRIKTKAKRVHDITRIDYLNVDKLMEVDRLHYLSMDAIDYYNITTTKLKARVLLSLLSNNQDVFKSLEMISTFGVKITLFDGTILTTYDLDSMLLEVRAVLNNIDSEKYVSNFEVEDGLISNLPVNVIRIVKPVNCETYLLLSNYRKVSVVKGDKFIYRIKHMQGIVWRCEAEFYSDKELNIQEAITTLLGEINYNKTKYTDKEIEILDKWSNTIAV